MDLLITKIKLVLSQRKQVHYISFNIFTVVYCIIDILRKFFSITEKSFNSIET